MPVPGKDTAIQDPTETASSPPASGSAPAAPQTLPVVASASASAVTVAHKAKGGKWIWAIGGLLAAALAGLIYLQPWATQGAAVTVETVTLGPVSRILAVNGRIAGLQSVDVRPLVSGTLVEMLVAEGDTVTRMQVLSRLDTTTQQAIVRQALAGLDAALVAQEDAAATHARTKALGGNVARAVLDSTARAAQTAQQEVARMTALLEQAQIQLEKFTIRAPIAGTVLVRHADPGETVDPATVLMSISDLGQLVVETNVDESYATQIRMGQPAALQLSGETAVMSGHVSFVSQKVDEATGGLAVKLAPQAALIAPIGLTVTANITVDERAAAITVPRAAILSDATGDAVLLVKDGKAVRRAVQVIDWPAARLIVTDGLTAGDVVIRDATGVVDGQAVKVSP